MTVLTKMEIAGILSRLGFRTDSSVRITQAVKDFQNGWNLGGTLVVDGLVGPLTQSALLGSDHRRQLGQSTASSHFSFSEFACKCNGKYASCRRIWVMRQLLQSLETYRSHSGPLKIVSGCRCPSYNSYDIHGAADSQHIYGSASDVEHKFPWTTVATWQVFAGIGYSKASGLVAHVDRRDVSGHNNGGTLAKPMTWLYA